MELEKINKVMMANQGYIDNVSARENVGPWHYSEIPLSRSAKTPQLHFTCKKNEVMTH